MSILGVVITLCPSANYGSPVVSMPRPSEVFYRDYEDGGNSVLSGTVGIDATPDVLGAYRVSLICKRSKRLIRQGWSNSSGQYRFDYIRPGPWIVLAEDHTGTYNAVVADNELAVAM